jgi:hypothetical protein
MNIIKDYLLKSPRKSFLSTGFALQTEELKSTFNRMIANNSEMRTASLQLVGFTLAMLALIQKDGVIPEPFRVWGLFLLAFSFFMPVVIFLLYTTEKRFLMKQLEYEMKVAKLFLNTQMKSWFDDVSWGVWEEFVKNFKKLEEEKPQEINKTWSIILGISSLIAWGIFCAGVICIFISYI